MFWSRDMHPLLNWPVAKPHPYFLSIFIGPVYCHTFLYLYSFVSSLFSFWCCLQFPVMIGGRNILDEIWKPQLSSLEERRGERKGAPRYSCCLHTNWKQACSHNHSNLFSFAEPHTISHTHTHTHSLKRSLARLPHLLKEKCAGFISDSISCIVTQSANQ